MTEATLPSPASPRARRVSHVARSSLLIAIFFAVDKMLGLFRQIVIGRQFGVSTELDVFNAANNLPDLLFALISGGALSVAFIPVLSEYLELDGREALWKLFSRVANLAFLVTGALAIVIAIFANQLVSSELGVAPGFAPEQQELVAQLMRLNLIATLIFSLSGLVAAGLQANQHFLLPALAPVLFDVGQIFGALVLAPVEGISIGGFTLPTAGLGIQGLVYGVILGAALHLIVQIPGLIRYKFRWSPKIDIHDPGVLKVARMLGPRILTIGAFQMIFVVQDNLASRLNVGSVTALAFGWLIMQVPETIIGTAIGIAILPTISEQFARGDDSAFEESVGRALRSILALTLPAAILLGLTVGPLVQAAFGFEPEATQLVVLAARAFLLGLVGHSLLEVAARSFYARQNAVTPLFATIANLTLFVIISIILFSRVGVVGIALGNSIAFTTEALIMLFLLWRRLPGIFKSGRPALRILVGALAGGLAAYAIITYLPVGALFGSLAGLAVGALVTLPFIWPELKGLVRL